MAYKVFISSNMVEFKEEREAIVSTIENDDFLNDFFKVFVFENIPSIEVQRYEKVGYQLYIRRI